MNDKKSRKNDEFLDEPIENDEDNVEYLDDEYEEDGIGDTTS